MYSLVYKCVYTHTSTQKIHKYICKENLPTYTKNIYRDKRFHGQLTAMGHSQTQILELKRSHLVKTILTIKTTAKT